MVKLVATYTIKTTIDTIKAEMMVKSGPFHKTVWLITSKIPCINFGFYCCICSGKPMVSCLLFS